MRSVWESLLDVSLLTVATCMLYPDLGPGFVCALRHPVLQCTGSIRKLGSDVHESLDTVGGTLAGLVDKECAHRIYQGVADDATDILRWAAGGE